MRLGLKIDLKSSRRPRLDGNCLFHGHGRKALLMMCVEVNRPLIDIMIVTSLFFAFIRLLYEHIRTILLIIFVLKDVWVSNR